MELNITRFFNEEDPGLFAASQAELGERAAEITWRASMQAGLTHRFLDTEDKQEEFRRFVKGFGAWSWEEIVGWSDAELNALCLQFIAGDIREGRLDADSIDWAAYERDAKRGTVSGRIFRGNDNQIYFYVGE